MSNHDSKRLILILGGARSGKSAYAEQLAQQMAYSAAPSSTPATGEPPLLVYLATATAQDGDEDMLQRIASHRRSRGDSWLTIEEPYNPSSALIASEQLVRPGAVVLLDCLTLLVSNVLLSVPGVEGEEPAPAADRLVAEERVEHVVTDLLAAYHRGAVSLICVSNEVGMGLVPPYPLGRIYRDILGRVNARIAREADVVLFMLAGLPIEVKSLASAWNVAAAQRLGLHQ